MSENGKNKTGRGKPINRFAPELCKWKLTRDHGIRPLLSCLLLLCDKYFRYNRYLADA